MDAPTDSANKPAPPKDTTTAGDKPQGGGNSGEDESPAVKKYREGQGNKPAQGPTGPSDSVKPDDKPKPDVKDKTDDKSKPDDKAKPTDIKDKYDTKDVQAAIKAAKDSGLPLVVHVGASWCGPCRQMEAGSWPQVEKDLKGKAVFLHLDGDQARNLKGDDKTAAEQFTKGVTGYPTIKVGTVDDKGTFQPADSQSGYMSPSRLRSYLDPHLKK